MAAVRPRRRVSKLRPRAVAVAPLGSSSNGLEAMMLSPLGVGGGARLPPLEPLPGPFKPGGFLRFFVGLGGWLVDDPLLLSVFSRSLSVDAVRSLLVVFFSLGIRQLVAGMMLGRLSTLSS